MNLDVSLRLLRAFAAVAREGNVGRAAASLYVSQPSLSQDIRRLERLVGVCLFVRTARGMDLTPAGAALHSGVEAGLLALDRAVTQAAEIGAGERRRVSLAFSPSVGNHLMPELLPFLDALAPDVALDEREVDTGEVGPGVCAGRYDLGLAHCPDPDPDLVSSLLAEEAMCVALAASHPAARRSRIALADLDGLDLVLWLREIAPAYHDHLLRVCARAGLTPRVVPGPRRTILRPHLFAGGTAFCLLPVATARLRVPGIAFVEVADEHARIPLCCVRRADDHRADVLAVERIVQDHSSGLLTDKPSLIGAHAARLGRPQRLAPSVERTGHAAAAREGQP